MLNWCIKYSDFASESGRMPLQRAGDEMENMRKCISSFTSCIYLYDFEEKRLENQFLDN